MTMTSSKRSTPVPAVVRFDVPGEERMGQVGLGVFWRKDSTDNGLVSPMGQLYVQWTICGRGVAHHVSGRRASARVPKGPPSGGNVTLGSCGRAFCGVFLLL